MLIQMVSGIIFDAVSINDKYLARSKKVLTARYRDFRNSLFGIVLRERITRGWPLDLVLMPRGTFRIDILLCHNQPRYLDGDDEPTTCAMDADAIIKPIFDACQHARIIDNDVRITAGSFEKKFNTEISTSFRLTFLR